MGFYDVPTDGLVAALSKRFPEPAQVRTLQQWLKERDDDLPFDHTTMLDTIDVAIEALQGLYVHQDLKLARRGIEPVRQLSVFRERVALRVAMPVQMFHAQMLRIFKSLGDAHTAYRLPPPYKTTIAFLPFVINAFGKSTAKRTYVVSHLLPEAEDQPGDVHFTKGVEITSWNGTPIDDAVRAATEFEEGSNGPNDFLAALQFMTVRWLGASFGPDSPWVVVGYRGADKVEREVRLFWLTLHVPLEQIGALVGSEQIVVPLQALAIVFEPLGCLDHFRCQKGSERSLHVSSASVHLGRKALFAKEDPDPKNARESQRIGQELMNRFLDYLDRDALREFTRSHESLRKPVGKDEYPTLLPLFLVAREHTIAEVIKNAGQPPTKAVEAAAALHFGYIGIRAFPPGGFARDLFPYELRRLINLMPGDGLIIDIRDNPGGSANLAEEALQLFTPKPITPLPFRFLASSTTKAFTEASAFDAYSESIRTALSTGGRFSAGLPATDVDRANAVGQHYFGPVILLTNGATYSAADIFAAGFEDHALGTLIGVDETTGGGGANCWFYNEDVMTLVRGVRSREEMARAKNTDKKQKKTGVTLADLTGGVNLQIAVRQCLRVGSKNEGALIEEVGVPTPEKHMTSLTEIDVLQPRPWSLLFFAAEKLLLVASAQRYDLSTTLIEQGGERRVAVRTENIDRLDFFLNGRPTSVAVEPGSGTPIESPLLPRDDRITLEIRGFAGSTLVARYVQVFRFIEAPEAVPAGGSTMPTRRGARRRPPALRDRTSPGRR